METSTEKQTQAPQTIADALDKFVLAVGSVMCWGAAVLIAVIILQVVLRYGFGHGLVLLEELQWHLYAVGVMFGLSYAQVKDSHIRVDIFHMGLSERTKRIFEIVGILIFLVPFIWIVFAHSIDFLYDSLRINERSDAPSGLPWRWAVKSVIPISFGMLALATLSRLIRDVAFLRQKNG